MSLPIVYAPGKIDLSITRGDTFGPYRLRWREYEGGPGVILTEALITARAAIRAPDADGVLVCELTTENGGVVIEDPEIVAPSAISSDFSSDGVIVSIGANFLSAGVVVGDRVTIDGTTLNDTAAARVVSVDSETQITTDQAFTAESAVGTVSVAHDGWFYIFINAGTNTVQPSQTGSFDFSSARWDVEFVDSKIVPPVVRTPIAGPVLLRRDSANG